MLSKIRDSSKTWSRFESYGRSWKVFDCFHFRLDPWLAFWREEKKFIRVFQCSNGVNFFLKVVQKHVFQWRQFIKVVQKHGLQWRQFIKVVHNHLVFPWDLLTLLFGSIDWNSIVEVACRFRIHQLFFHQIREKNSRKKYFKVRVNFIRFCQIFVCCVFTKFVKWNDHEKFYCIKRVISFIG